MSAVAERTVDDTLSMIQSGCDSDSVIAALRTYTADAGFDFFSYYIVQPPDVPAKNFLATNYPVSWREQYTTEHYVSIDPVVQQAAQRLTPFLWDRTIDRRTLTPTQKKFFSEAEGQGVLMGGSVPLRGPGRCMATMSVSTNCEAEKFSALWFMNRHNLHLLACYAHERLIPMLFAEKRESLFSLSPRERECLLWTARGKSAWEIGEILTLSQSTVEEYLGTACKKLNVRSKIQAVVIAVMNGLIIV